MPRREDSRFFTQKSWFDEDTYVENGVTLLYSGDIPIGTGCLFREDGSDSGGIEFLSVREGFRGRGLGRHLLRHEINLATTNWYAIHRRADFFHDIDADFKVEAVGY